MMYLIEFDGLRLFNKRYESLEEAIEIVKTSERLTNGKVTDLNGNVLFSVSRGVEHGKKEKDVLG